MSEIVPVAVAQRELAISWERLAAGLLGVQVETPRQRRLSQVLLIGAGAGLFRTQHIASSVACLLREPPAAEQGSGGALPPAKPF